jgi:hypothetical protein
MYNILHFQVWKGVLNHMVKFTCTYAHSEIYPTNHDLIKFVSHFVQVGDLWISLAINVIQQIMQVARKLYWKNCFSFKLQPFPFPSTPPKTKYMVKFTCTYAHSEIYPTNHDLIKFVSHFVQVGDFLQIFYVFFN